MTDVSTDHREAVAGEVRAWMGRRRVSQTELATALGMSQAAISRRLSCEVPFDLDDLFRIADYFALNPCDLLGSSSPWTKAISPADKERTTANLVIVPKAA